MFSIAYSTSLASPRESATCDLGLWEDVLKTVTVLRCLALSVLLLVLSACGLVAPEPAPPVEPVMGTRDAGPTVSAPTDTPFPAEPTPTPNPCPELRDIELPDRNQSVDAFIASLRQYLAQGGDPARVQLQEFEELQQGDLTGDGVAETVFLLLDPDTQSILPKGHLAIFSCEAGDVKMLYHYETGEWMGLELIGIADLTEDGIADLSFSEVSCGAHTCWHTPYVWSWQGRDFENRIGGELIFPFPWFTLENDSLVVVSHGMGSVGAGPQRTITSTLGWAGTAITITGEIVAPPSYRYHAFVDGDRALAGGNSDVAEAAYRRVVEDPSLELWGAFSSPEEEQAWLLALGYWRLMTLQAHLGNSAEAGALYETLREENAPGTTAYAVVGLAERFWRGYERNGDVPAACNYVLGGAEIDAVVDFLMTFGYANPVYEALHLCPFTPSGVAEMPF